MNNSSIKKIYFIIFFGVPLFIFGQFMKDSPFNYDLHLTSLIGKNNRVLICFHGYGDNYKIALTLRNLVDSTLISFNFPEYDIKIGREYNPKDATFGTIHELLPALYVLKKTICEQNLNAIDLYGFSAGGGALINLLGVLNTSAYDQDIKKIGIGEIEKQKLLSAIQKGIVILDCPLKSIEEIMDFRGYTEELRILEDKYNKNNLRPIDSLVHLKGLFLNIILYFQEKDEFLSNRDDQLFIKRLKQYLPKSEINIIVGTEKGHMSPHLSLWQAYSQKITKQ